MNRDIYPAARLIAPRVQAHFARHLAAAEAHGNRVHAPLAEARDIERIIDASFWASLRREEGYIPKISIAYLPPENTTDAMRFAAPLALTPGVLSKIAPIVERAGIHLGVWPDGEGLSIWGTTHAVPPFCFVLEVVEPGLLVVKHARGERSGKYINVAVLEGDRFKIVDESARTLPDCPTLLTSLLGFDSPTSWTGPVNVLVQLAVSMRAHGRGGSLLIVPSTSDQWRDSIITPIAYAVTPRYRGLADLMQANAGARTEGWAEALREAVDAIAGLTAVDGATVITDTYELLAFGAKITRRRGSNLVETVTITEPIEGGEPRAVAAPQLGGTRHLSAAQFVHDQRDAVAMVASQDRRFTVFAWSPCAKGVHGHRVETLLL
jgi:hypothetical protein